MPQPSLGFIPSKPCSSSRSRTPLGAACSLAVLDRASLRPRPRSTCCPGFRRRARREAWLPGSPPERPAPFQPSLRTTSPTPWIERERERRSTSPTSSASKPSSLHEAVPQRRRSGDHGPCSPGLAPLQSLPPIEPRTLRPGGPFRPPRASSRDDEGGDPSSPGEDARPRGRSTSSAPDPRSDRRPARAASRRQSSLPRPSRL